MLMDFSVYLRDEESPPIATKWCRQQVRETGEGSYRSWKIPTMSDVAVPGLPQELKSTFVTPGRFAAGSIHSRFVPFRTKVVVVPNESLQPFQTGSPRRIVDATQSQWDSGPVEE